MNTITQCKDKNMIILYGIPNCDTIKKARKWLADHSVLYQFHDYKKLGIDESLLREWIAKVGWEVLLNRRGTTWRKLSPEQKDNINQESAIKFMLSSPSLIKRPVLIKDKLILVGFDQEKYTELV